MSLTETEIQYLKTPLKDLDASGRALALAAYDKKVNEARAENAQYVPPIRKKTINIIRDDLGMRGVKNQADGKMYDSKSQLRKSYKRHGVEEVGNDPIPDKPREQRGDYDCRADVARAMEQIGFDEKVKRR